MMRWHPPLVTLALVLCHLWRFVLVNFFYQGILGVPFIHSFICLFAGAT